MPPMQDRPRSLSGPTSQFGWGSFTSSSSSAEELPTTPLPVTPVPATPDPFEQADTALLSVPQTPLPPTLLRQASSPGLTRQLSGPGITLQLSNPGVTRQLSHAGMVEGAEGAAARGPVVIKGDLKKKEIVALSPRVHNKRRLLVTISGILILALLSAVVLLSASPLGHDVGLSIGAQPTGNTLSSGQGGNLSLVAQATATAVYHQQSDGYDPYSNGSIVISNGSGSLNWPVGQCTYWSNFRYHELTGHWVSWSGNANQWVAGARAAGWNVSQQPHVPSIIVLMSYVQGAGGFGHVAVVESVDDSVTPEKVHTSNMNWWVDGGAWNKESTYDFTPGPGVYFVWHE